jgi:hypothetical protein
MKEHGRHVCFGHFLTTTHRKNLHRLQSNSCVTSSWTECSRISRGSLGTVIASDGSREGSCGGAVVRCDIVYSSLDKQQLTPTSVSIVAQNVRKIRKTRNRNQTHDGEFAHKHNSMSLPKLCILVLNAVAWIGLFPESVIKWVIRRLFDVWRFCGRIHRRFQVAIRQDDKSTSSHLHLY